MDHDAFVFDFVEVDGALEGGTVGDDGVGGGVFRGTRHAWNGDGADDSDDDDDDDQFDEGEGGSMMARGAGLCIGLSHRNRIGMRGTDGDLLGENCSRTPVKWVIWLTH